MNLFIFIYFAYFMTVCRFQLESLLIKLWNELLLQIETFKCRLQTHLFPCALAPPCYTGWVNCVCVCTYIHVRSHNCVCLMYFHLLSIQRPSLCFALYIT